MTQHALGMISCSGRFAHTGLSIGIYAIGITEETDAVVIVVSEETATISLVMGGDMIRDLDAPRLRAILREILGGSHRKLASLAEVSTSVDPEGGSTDDPENDTLELDAARVRRLG